MGKSLDFFSNNGQIDNVRYCAACRYNCCKTDGDNFIVLFPWEIKAAKAAGLSVDHLVSIKDDPQYVHCIRPCTGQNDYKPINCATYPLYPVTEDLSVWVRGAKSRCPISDIRLRQQVKAVADGLRRIEELHPGSIKMMVEFIKSYPGDLESLESE
ncbi:MAG: hypothetical protein LBF37_00075 [Rickettsiales bacterium]|jgi:hypothetical protein|nr:hypothetical protein [Rickettsiales bacterium]